MPMNPEISFGPIHLSVWQLFSCREIRRYFCHRLRRIVLHFLWRVSEQWRCSSPGAATLLKPSGPFISHCLSPPRWRFNGCQSSCRRSLASRRKPRRIIRQTNNPSHSRSAQHRIQHQGLKFIILRGIHLQIMELLPVLPPPSICNSVIHPNLCWHLRLYV